MDGDKKLKLEKDINYYNLKYLIVFLLLTGVNIHLINTWTPDKGWILFIIFIQVTVSILFWILLSTISRLKKTHLKKELLYYVGIGILNIIMTIEYFKFEIIEANNDLIYLTPHFLIILLSLLPIKQIWISKRT